MKFICYTEKVRLTAEEIHEKMLAYDLVILSADEPMGIFNEISKKLRKNGNVKIIHSGYIHSNFIGPFWTYER